MTASYHPDPQTSKPLVWIVIVNWNGKADTLNCLASLRRITYQPHLVLVIDNASTDGSVAAIREAFPEVRILANARNERYARANNQGIELALAAGAEFVLLLNNDTEVAPDFLDHLVLAALFRREVGMVGPKIYYHQQPQLIWFAGGKINWWSGRIYHLGLRQIDHASLAAPQAVDYLTGCALLVRRACVEKIGLLDEAYHMYAEDADWCQRARQAGFLCLYQPEARVWHKISASTSASYKIYHKVLGNFRFYRKYARWYHWLTIPFGVACGALHEILRLALTRPRQADELAAALARGFRDALLRRQASP
ncbi:MAG: glycosyltransferase family 2 protein [candidate division KSB1 bacterium]|nr:glycosyltransferase family 2 protein [candidate division KSB1 bacterium]MDZ7274852.1 glycosyltransferase family 2 protein [candidate division KSB1 bacterium]MDZ7288219.1 glycosyltransferase family 2 protein [candidate division KSB1 bacterium]MDZ7300400.1 glycosyltransferase family 2 protein [candidate division KSB1 bacterium]MDZ7308775.1 glycosyltransferase family 2 protein [candidate division KSB1 bacterium]